MIFKFGKDLPSRYLSLIITYSVLKREDGIFYTLFSNDLQKPSPFDNLRQLSKEFAQFYQHVNILTSAFTRTMGISDFKTCPRWFYKNRVYHSNV